MVKKLLVAFVAMFTLQMVAQQGTSSPYSFYGIGELSFRGTVENKTMGGISVLADSIHLNLQNPASLAKLKLTTFTAGANQNFNSLQTNTDKEEANTTSLDYLAVGLPFKKMAVSFGLMPYSSVGYKTGFVDPFTANVGDKRFEGSGGLNRVFLASGFSITKNLSLGAEINYNFGKIEQEAFEIVDGDLNPYDVREYNLSKLSGLSLNFGLMYDKMITEKLQIMSSLSYSPGLSLKSDNTRDLSTVIWNPNTSLPVIRDTESVDLGDEARTDFDMPSRLSVGVALSQPKKWLLGLDVTSLGTGSVSSRTFELPLDGGFTNSTQYALGGYYIPKFNSLTSYWKRVVYRAGVRFEKTGLEVKNTDIEEFGISFGAGLPVGRVFSNMNIMLEYGRRGTKDKDLVRENFVNIGVSLSFNDKWFQRRKID